MKTLEIYNPFSSEKIAELECDDKNSIQQKLINAFNSRETLSIEKRKRILLGANKEILKRKSILAELISKESGLSIKDTTHEVERVANVALYCAKVTENIEDDTTSNYIFSPDAIPELKVITEPMRLVVGITPFNHPLNQVAHKVFPAIAAGAPIIIKPSEKTPLSAIELRKILISSGLPEEKFNIIVGNNPSQTLDDILSFEDIDMLSFTGGLDVGRLIQKRMVEKGLGLKKFVPELGGSSSLIICDDADINSAVKIALEGCFKNSGQRCTAIRKVIVDKKVKCDFEEQLLEEVKKITFGDPFISSMGTVIDIPAAIKIDSRVQNAIKQGAKKIYGFDRSDALISPTILSNISLQMEVVDQETFGPICPIIESESFKQSLKIANATKYKLAGAIVTNDFEKAKHASNFLKVGQFSHNGVPGYRTEMAPFGGFGNSGNGEKEGAYLAARSMRTIRTFYRH